MFDRRLYYFKDYFTINSSLNFYRYLKWLFFNLSVVLIYIKIFVILDNFNHVKNLCQK